MKNNSYYFSLLLLLSLSSAPCLKARESKHAYQLFRVKKAIHRRRASRKNKGKVKVYIYTFTALAIGCFPLLTYYLRSRRTIEEKVEQFLDSIEREWKEMEGGNTNITEIAKHIENKFLKEKAKLRPEEIAKFATIKSVEVNMMQEDGTKTAKACTVKIYMPPNRTGPSILEEDVSDVCTICLDNTNSYIACEQCKLLTCKSCVISCMVAKGEIAGTCPGCRTINPSWLSMLYIAYNS